MILNCPKCRARLQLAQLKCRECQKVFELDKAWVAGKPAAACPHCGQEQRVTRVKCNRCQTVIDVAQARAQAKAAPAPAPRPPTPAVQPPAATAAPAPRAAPQTPPPAPKPAPRPAVQSAQAAPQARPAGQPGVPAFKFSPALLVVLWICTATLFMLYWCPKVAKVVNAVTTGKKIGPVMAFLTGLSCCSPMIIKFYWRAAGALGANRLLLTLLAVFGLQGISAAILQGKINQLAERA